MERRPLRRIDASPADVGRRLTLRYKTDALGLGHAEAAGVLVRWSGTGDEGILMLRRRDETSVRIPFDAVEVARVIPPEVSAYRMQELAEATWPPREYQDLGNWRLRWAGPHAGRADSVRVAGAADRPLPAALRTVRDWYRERGTVPLLQAPFPSRIDELFDDAGWAVVRRSRLMITATQRLFITTGSSMNRSDMVLSCSDVPDSEWLELLQGDDIGAQDEVQPILTAPRTVAFASCRSADTGELLGIGRGVVVGDWGGANNMVTAPAARRRGVATAIMAQLNEWGAQQGATRWFLRVNADSEPALALYDGLGFTRHHDYVYRAPESPDEGAIDVSGTDD